MMRFFCAGETRAKTWTCSTTWGERGIVHMVQFAAQHDPVALQPHLLTHVAGDQFIVTRQDLNLTVSPA